MFVLANLYLGDKISALDPQNVMFYRTAFVLFTTASVVAGMSLVNSVTKTSQVIFQIAFLYLGFWFYLLIFSLTIDLVSLVITIPSAIKVALSYGLAFLLSLYGLWNARQLKVTEQNLTIRNLNGEIRLAHLTDTHLGHFRGAKNLINVVNEINRQKVDVVFFTGDLLDGRIQMRAESLLPLKQIEAPVFFVEGNHDIYTGASAIKNHLRTLGIQVLTNQVVEWRGLQIIGLNHMPADRSTRDIHASAMGPTIKSVLQKLAFDKDKPTVLLHHSPSGIRYASEANVDLYLAGHTHAGQMWPATYIAKAMFEYNRGLHKFENTQIYVSQGTGTFGPPMRVGTRSELAILNLKPVF